MVSGSTTKKRKKESSYSTNYNNGPLTGETLVIDNGADTIKAGFAGEGKPRVIMPNCKAKLKTDNQELRGDEINKIKKTSDLKFSRPFERGLLTNIPCEIDVWDRLFCQENLNIDSQSMGDLNVLLTETPMTPKYLAQFSTEVMFEEFGFKSLAKCPAATLSAYEYLSPYGNKSPLAVTVVDTGFSFSHVIPIVGRQTNYSSIKRVNIGGKALTNFLKSTVSYRQYNLMEEFMIMDDMKKKLCKVAADFPSVINNLHDPKFRRDLREEYVLPDFQEVMKGFVRGSAEDPGEEIDITTKDIVRIEDEVYSVPELLFRPSDVGMKQAGLAEAIVQSISSCSLEEQGMLYENILLTGGNAKFQGIKTRLESEIRPLVPDYFQISVKEVADPITYAWCGGSRKAKQPDFLQNCMVTKQMYEEEGHDRCNLNFDNWL